MKKIASEKNYRMLKIAEVYESEHINWPWFIQQGFAEYLSIERQAKSDFKKYKGKWNKALASFNAKIKKAEATKAFGDKTKEIVQEIVVVVKNIRGDDLERIRAINKLVGL